MNSTRNPPRKPPPQRLRFAGALVLVFAAMVPATLPAQVGAGVARTTRLEVTSTSAEARTALTGALEDISGIFPGRATLRLRRAVELDPKDLVVRIKRAELWLRLGIFDRAHDEMREGLLNGGGSPSARAAAEALSPNGCARCATCCTAVPSSSAAWSGRGSWSWTRCRSG